MLNIVLIIVFSFIGLILISSLIGLWIFIHRLKRIKINFIVEDTIKTTSVKQGTKEVSYGEETYFIKQDFIFRKGLQRNIFFIKGIPYPIKFNPALKIQGENDYNSQEIESIVKTKIIKEILESDKDKKIIVILIIVSIFLSVVSIVMPFIAK